MSAPQAKVFTRTSLYLLARGLQHLGGLLLLPLLVASLSSEEFTRYGLMTSAFQLLVPILSLNLHLAPVRLYFDHQDTGGRARLLVSALASACALTVAGLALIVTLLQLLDYPEPVALGAWDVQSLIGLSILFIVVADFGKLLMVIRGEAHLYAAVAAGQSFGLLLLFLLIRRLPIPGLQQVVWSYCVSLGLIAFLASVYSRRFLAGGRLSRAELGAALAYSWPTVVHLVASWAVVSSGRWIGAFHMPLEKLAPFTLMTLLVGVIGVLPRSLFEARLPDIGSAFGAGRYREGAGVIRGTAALGLGTVAAVYAVAFFALFRLGLELPAGYQPTPALLGFAALASLLDSLYLGGIQILHALKKTQIQASSSIFSGVLTVTLSVVLVRTHAVTGLMLAIVAGIALQSITSNLLAQRYLGRAEVTSG